MGYSFALERAYLSKEFCRPAPSPLRIVGTMLDSAFAQPRADRDLDRLVRQLDAPAAP